MPHVFNEITRYGLVEQLQMRKVVNDSKAYLTLRCEDGSLVNLSPEEEVRLIVTTALQDTITDVGPRLARGQRL